MPAPRPALDGVTRADALVVGGSFAGLAAAQTLAAAGREVLLLEADQVGRAAGRAAGILASATELDLIHYQATYGDAAAQALWDQAERGVARIGEVVTELGLVEACYERRGSLYLFGAADRDELTREAAARRTLGAAAELREVPVNPFASQGLTQALFAPGDATVDPCGLALAWARALEARGVRIHDGSPVIRLVDARTVETPQGRVEAGLVVLAGQGVAAGLGRRRRALGFVSACAVSEPLSPARIEALGLRARPSYWDTSLPYVYGRLTPDDRVLVGGADLWLPLARSSPGLVRRLLRGLVRATRRRTPLLREVAFPYVWSGAIVTAPDAQPRVGRVDGVVVATDAAGIGQAALAGELAARLALDGTPPPAALRWDRPVPLVPRVGGLAETAALALHMLGWS